MQEGLVHTLTTPTADCSLQLLPGDHHLWTHGSQSRGWNQRRWGDCKARCSTCCPLTGVSHDDIPRRPLERKMRDPCRELTSQVQTSAETRQTSVVTETGRFPHSLN